MKEHVLNKILMFSENLREICQFQNDAIDNVCTALALMENKLNSMEEKIIKMEQKLQGEV